MGEWWGGWGAWCVCVGGVRVGGGGWGGGGGGSAQRWGVCGCVYKGGGLTPQVVMTGSLKTLQHSWQHSFTDGGSANTWGSYTHTRALDTRPGHHVYSIRVGACVGVCVGVCVWVCVAD